MSTPAFILIVLINPNVAGTGDFTVSVDGREVSQFALAGKPADPPEVRIAIPENAARLTIERRASLPLIGVKLARYAQTFDLVSVAGITLPLREQPPAISLLRLGNEVDAVLTRMGSETTADTLDLSFGEKQAPDAIRDAEGRLGFDLDPELKRVLATIGPVKFQDSWVTAAGELATTEQQFTTIWGHPESVSAETRAIYRTSTMIWVEAGDGYGAVIYQPKRPEPCGGGPAYWQIHQDHIDSPKLITRADGSCGGLADALFAMFSRDLLERIEDEGVETQLLVDPTMADFPVWLETGRDGLPRLRPDWSVVR
jgi:hypothetical protein